MARKASADEQLMERDVGDLRAMMLACSAAHASMCAVASKEPDPHADLETMKSRVDGMGKEELVKALSPFAALGEIITEHHAGHSTH